MGNRTSYTKSRNGKVVESGEYTYNLSNQLVSAKLYDGKKNTTMKYTANSGLLRPVLRSKTAAMRS